MTQKNFTPFCLLESISSVEEFLKSSFHCSSGRVKKYFDRSFLNRSLKAHTQLNLPLDFVNDGEINPQYEGPVIDIVYEDETFLVMNKPHDLFVHPLTYSEKNNCLSFLRKERPEVLSVNKDEYDRGLLYRLDYETSGVLVYVKNGAAYHYLREHFKTIAKKKIYHCLVEGECKLHGEFTHFFSSSEEKGKRVIVKDEGSYSGSLKLKPVKYFRETDVTLMEVELGQGLRHQIRAQLSHLGFPIRGDKFYGGKAASRLYLNASKYEISWEGKDYSFSSEPSYFEGL